MKNNRKISLILIAAFIMLSCLAAGCDKSATNVQENSGNNEKNESVKKEIKVGMAYEPETLDLANYGGDTSLEAIRLSVEPLLRAVDGKAEQGIAKSYEVSEDLMEYTFHLRESTYSDGTPVTANDVYYSVTRTLDPKMAYLTAYKLYGIVGAQEYNLGEGSLNELGVEVIDDYTIKFKMKELTFPIVFTQVQFAPVSQKAVEEYGQQYGTEAKNVLTNGPYTVTDWVHESTITFTKNDKYWNKEEISLDTITSYINAANETAVDMMLAGELDGCKFSSRDLISTLEETGDYQNIKYYTGYQFIHMNHKGKTEDTGKWLSNTNFRKALSYAIDREAMVKAVYTTDDAAYRLTSPSELGVESTFNEEYPYDGWPTAGGEEKAKEFLAVAMKELGAGDVSEIPTFSMLCFDSENNMKCLNAISDMWERALGIKSIIDAQPLSSMLDKANSGDFDLWKGGKALGFMDWMTEVGVIFTSANGAPINYVSEEYDALYNKVVNATDLKSRKAAMFELEKYYCENALDLQITWNKQEYVARKNMSKIYITSDGYIDLTYADINE